MLWALTASNVYHLDTVKIDLPVVHMNRQGNSDELGTEKNTAELLGSIVFNALKNCKNLADESAFASALHNIADMRIEMVKHNIQSIETLLDEIEQRADIVMIKDLIELQDRIASLGLQWLSDIKSVLSDPQFISSVRDQYLQSIPLRLVISNISNDIPLDQGKFALQTTNDESIKLLVHGELWTDKRPLVRVHSSCTHSEVFGAKDCDCDSQLQSAKELIAGYGAGVIFYLEQEGRGHGFLTKLKIVDSMKKQNINTYEACEQLGIEEDKRNYHQLIQLMRDTGLSHFTLLTNNATKLQPFSKYFDIKKRMILGDYNDDNYAYLMSKSQNTHSDLFITKQTLDAVNFCRQMPTIKFYEVTDAYGFLSNFDRRPIYREGKIWPTAEHAYQAQKFLDPELRNTIRGTIRGSIREEKDPNIAKKIADQHKEDIREDWEDIKIAVMCAVLKDKLSQYTELKQQLLNTGQSEIIEYTEKDKFWGRGACGAGHNYLGKLWMFLRAYYSGPS